jgi:hypothetical protein
MDIGIIQHKDLRFALAQGLNHIPLQPTTIVPTVAIIMNAYQQFTEILDLEQLGFPVNIAREQLHATCLATLKDSMHYNKFGHRYSGKFLLDLLPVKNEIAWLLQHLFCSRLDKASNNVCFMCIKHIRLQALERLTGHGFTPCKENLIWSLPSQILDQIVQDLKEILPESPPPYQALPYLMATFKQYKAKYRWLTNAYCTVFSNIAVLLTISSKLVLEAFKKWACEKERDYRKFLQVNTSLYWIVDSVIDTTLNLPERLSNIFVADITRCYETIPLHGPDNLLEAISFISSKAFIHAGLSHPRATTNLWIRVSQEGTPATAKWATTRPRYGSWTELTLDRLILLHKWLMNNCFITLDDRVWR